MIYCISEIIVVLQSARKRGRCYPNHSEGSALVFVRRGGGGVWGGGGGLARQTCDYAVLTLLVCLLSGVIRRFLRLPTEFEGNPQLAHRTESGDMDREQS